MLRLTERDALARFVTSDPRIRALNARIDETRASQAERTLWPNPSATFSRESVLGAHDTFLLARQELPMSGRRSRLQTAGRLAVDAAEAEAQLERVQLQADVREAYTALLLAQQQEETLQGSIDALQKLISVLRTREEGGEGSTYDRMRGQRVLIDLEAERSLAAGDRARAQGRLASYLGPGTTPEALVAADSLIATTPPPPLPALIEQALAYRGDYRASELSIARFEAERAAATRLQIPTPTLTGGLKRSDLGGTTSSGYQVSVDLSIPWFSRGQAAAALATAQKARAQAEAESWRLQIAAEVRAAYNVARIQQERVTRYQASATAIAEPLAKIGRVGYEEGELSILELLDADRQALDARLRILDLAAAARRAAIEFDRAIGREFRP
ncbi:MAG TPA: TolC family protein [Vicinamibacterales bacterium]|nr:TolC family protein [Vicinamibacterales bacterium]